MDALVSVDWLSEHLRDPDLRVFDATVRVDRLLFVPIVRSGRGAWRREHIPGSAFADLFALNDPAAPRLRFGFPSAEHFAAAAGALGMGNAHRVVVCDRRDSMWAARLWWMLRVFGHDAAAVLDGGWRAWAAARGPTCKVPCVCEHATFVPRQHQRLVFGKQEMLASIGDSRVFLVAARGRHRARESEVVASTAIGHLRRDRRKFNQHGAAGDRTRRAEPDRSRRLTAPCNRRAQEARSRAQWVQSIGASARSLQ